MKIRSDPNSSHSSPARRAAARVSCLLALLGSGALMAQSQPDTTVLRGADVNPDKLVELLTPDPPPVLTRGLKVDREGSLPAAVRRPSASLLITFETNSARLTPNSRQQLDTVAAALKSNQLQSYGFNLEGHADPRGQASTNRQLSQMRAESVRDYLVATHGIPLDRLAPIGKGDTEPLNTRDVAAPENRRVTIVTRPQ
jgi:OmpA-OmpF porin, OOP family